MRVQVPPVEQDYRPRLLYSPLLSSTTPAPSGPLWRNTSHRLLLLCGDGEGIAIYDLLHALVMPVNALERGTSVRSFCVFLCALSVCFLCSTVCALYALSAHLFLLRL